MDENKKLESNKNLIKSFEDLEKKYSTNDKLREEIIIRSRDIIKPSKQAIYSLHRNNIETAKKLIETAKKNITEIKNILEKSEFKEVGAFRNSLEEFIEATSFLFVIENKKIPTLEELELPLKVSTETYLLGLSDLTGELVRKSVTNATNKQYLEVEEFFFIVEELYGLFMKFNFRGGELRKKFDSIRYNLSKIQSIVYDIHMRR